MKKNIKHHLNNSKIVGRGNIDTFLEQILAPFTLLVSYKHFNKNGGNKLVAWTQNSPKETIHDEQNTIKTIKPNEFPWNIQQ